jgi:hypothetical protein
MGEMYIENGLRYIAVWLPTFRTTLHLTYQVFSKQMVWGSYMSR